MKHVNFSKKFLEAANRTHTPMYKIVLQKEKLGGQISLSKHNGFPPYVPKVLRLNDAK